MISEAWTIELNVFFLVLFHLAGISTPDHHSGGEPGEFSRRTYDVPSTVNISTETSTSKQRRDKPTIKSQQDEEEERGLLFSLKSFVVLFFDSFTVFPLKTETIEVYDGNTTFRSHTPRCISVSKQATYNQILVCLRKKSSSKNTIWFGLLQFQGAALRTFHINDDFSKYCLTVPTNGGKKTSLT